MPKGFWALWAVCVGAFFLTLATAPLWIRLISWLWEVQEHAIERAVAKYQDWRLERALRGR